MSDTPDSGPVATPLKGFPWSKLWTFVGALLVLATNTAVSHYQADSKKGEAVEESAKKSKEEIKTTVKPSTDATVEEIKQLKELVAKLAIEQARLVERDAARRKKAPHARADTAKVEGALADAKATLKAIKVKALTPNPALAPIPDAPTPAPQIPTARIPDDARKQ